MKCILSFLLVFVLSLQATAQCVRIKCVDDRGLRNGRPDIITTFGSGTIIGVKNDEVVILSCAHIIQGDAPVYFRLINDGEKKYKPAKLIKDSGKFDLSLITAKLENHNQKVLVARSLEGSSQIRAEGFGSTGQFRAVIGNFGKITRSGYFVAKNIHSRQGDSGGGLYTIINNNGKLSYKLVSVICSTHDIYGYWSTEGPSLSSIQQFIGESEYSWVLK